MSLTVPHGSIATLTITSMDWRVDVLIASSSHVNRLSAVTVVLSLTLSDGRVLQWRLGAADVHQWRYQLAKAVRDLAYLQMKQPPAHMFSGKKR